MKKIFIYDYQLIVLFSTMFGILISGILQNFVDVSASLGDFLISVLFLNWLIFTFSMMLGCVFSYDKMLNKRKWYYLFFLFHFITSIFFYYKHHRKKLINDLV